LECGLVGLDQRHENRYIQIHQREALGSRPVFVAFSHSRSQLGTVIRYIQNHPQHHAKKSFRTGYLQLLDKFGVEYDQRYVFKFVGD
jgi:hypothetical protein